jgi:hypothetical protein
MVTAQLRIAFGHRVGLIARVLEARGGRVFGVPEKSRLVGGDEQDLAGVQ